MPQGHPKELKQSLKNLKRGTSAATQRKSVPEKPSRFFKPDQENQNLAQELKINERMELAKFKADKIIHNKQYTEAQNQAAYKIWIIRAAEYSQKQKNTSKYNNQNQAKANYEFFDVKSNASSSVENDRIALKRSNQLDKHNLEVEKQRKESHKSRQSETAMKAIDLIRKSFRSFGSVAQE